MENTSHTVSDMKFIECMNGGAYRPEIWTYPGYSVLETRMFRRSGRRERPHVLDVSVNTASEYYIRRHTLLQLGKTGPSDPWKPYGSYEFAWESPVGKIAWDAVESLANLTELDELRPVVQNKILSDVVSGKAQLPVDLIELRKTKKMMVDAGLSLFQAFRDIRAGRPFRQFAQAMQKEGFSGLAGRKWLEFIYGWSPTVASIYETADVLSNKLNQGLVVRGKVKARLKRSRDGFRADYGNAYVEAYCDTTAKGCYQYTVRDPKLLRLSQLGFTNPLSIAWELTPWSFVLDWFVDVGDYINRMDFALGISDFTWQYGCFQKSHVFMTYYCNPVFQNIVYKMQPGKSVVSIRHNKRYEPTREIVNTFRGFKQFTNETVRLTSAVALLNQQRQRLYRLSL